jgi:F-type H+-transporting ATPase subunit b
MMDIVTQLATSEPVSGDVFGALGIDWKTLIFQMIAFVVLVWLLGKFVYPVLIKTVDERQEQIEAGAKAAKQAEEKAAAAEENVEKLMKQARKDASEIVKTAKEEAAAAIEDASTKASTQAERIVAEAHIQVEKDIVAAKKALRSETIQLVAEATEKVVGKTISSTIDQKLMTSSLKEVE